MSKTEGYSDSRVTVESYTDKSSSQNLLVSKHKISKAGGDFPWLTIALMVGAIGLVTLGTLSHFHVGVLAHLGDAGTAYLAMGGCVGGAVLAILAILHRIIKGCKFEKPVTLVYSEDTVNQTPSTSIVEAYIRRVIPNQFQVNKFSKNSKEAKKKMALNLKITKKFGTSKPGAVARSVKEETSKEYANIEEESGVVVRSKDNVAVALTNPSHKPHYIATALEVDRKIIGNYYQLGDPPGHHQLRLRNLIENLLTGKKKLTERVIANAIELAFIQLNHQFLKEKIPETSLACALVINNKLYVASVGNCRAVIRHEETSTYSLTKDTEHRLGHHEESFEESIENGKPLITCTNVEKGDRLIIATSSFWEYATVSDIHNSFFDIHHKQGLDDTEKTSAKEIAIRFTAAAKKAGLDKPSTLVAIEI